MTTFDQVALALAAAASVVPFDSTEIYSWRYRTDGHQAGEQGGSILFNSVGPDYFRALDIPIRFGRSIDTRDAEGSEPVVVVNERFARTAFPDEPALGRRVQWSFDGQNWNGWRTIVGIAGDTRDRGPQSGVVPTVYEAWTQGPMGSGLLIRTLDGTAPGEAAQEAARLIRAQDPKRPIAEVTTLDDALAARMAPSRLNATLFGGFGLLALGIASVGVGGVLAFAVSERRRELGIRAALGASRRRILGGVLAEGLVLALGGLLTGVFGGLVLMRLLEGLLFEVRPLDPAAFAATSVLIAAVAAVACWLPARSATRVDPAVVLRAE